MSHRVSMSNARQMFLKRGLDMTFVHCGVVILLVSFVSAELQCGVDEIAYDCPSDCPYDYCPKSENNINCVKPESCPPAACKCTFNFRRAENGTCIPTRECPPFECTGKNERYVSCPAYCPTDDCSQATPDGRCPYTGLFLIVRECNPSCRCVENHWRKNNVCVPYDQCN